CSDEADTLAIRLFGEPQRHEVIWVHRAQLVSGQVFEREIVHVGRDQIPRIRADRVGNDLPILGRRCVASPDVLSAVGDNSVPRTVFRTTEVREARPRA
ncbi:MAG: hypothetical protein ACTMHH_04010, partial [Nesterenkonia sp.]